MKIEMKKTFCFLTLAVIVCSAFAAEWMEEPYTPPQYEGIKLRIEKDVCDWVITEDAELFRAKYATVHLPEYHLTYAQQKELARRIARTIVLFHNQTNAQIRFVHTEYPEAKGTNVWDVIIQKLNGKLVTDEIVPVFDEKDFHADSRRGHTER